MFLKWIFFWFTPLLIALFLNDRARIWTAQRLDPAYSIPQQPFFSRLQFLGSILIPGILAFLGWTVFGWTRPIALEQSSTKLKGILIPLAGPISNLCLALCWTLLFKISLFFCLKGSLVALNLAALGQVGAQLSLNLMILNLLPIPPLAGSRILSNFLSPNHQKQYQKLSPYGFFILLILIVSGLTNFLTNPAQSLLSRLMLGQDL